ncbi:MAG: divergent polysaccharide deacetylase family protein [Pseudomonadales bacterium]
MLTIILGTAVGSRKPVQALDAPSHTQSIQQKARCGAGAFKKTLIANSLIINSLIINKVTTIFLLILKGSVLCTLISYTSFSRPTVMSRIIRLLSFSVLPLCLNSPTTLAETKPSPQLSPTIVLIIDDMGNGLELGQRAIALPGAINYAFLPHSPNSKRLARAAYQQGKEILLHIPMSNLQDRATGPGKLSPFMDKAQFLLTVRTDLQAIPHVRGVNNHMGSLLTQLREPMGWLMAELKQQNLYFIDSRTSPLTVGESLAQSYKLPTASRDVFLDNQRNTAAISTQFEHAITLAKQQDFAVVIAHPHPETLVFLKQAIPTLEARGVKFSLASDALNTLNATHY